MIFMVSAPRSYSQEQDTVYVADSIHRHTPQKAVILSLICPGLGQIYNKKYWKLPIIYGAGGAFAYFVVYNQMKYVKFRDAYFDELSKLNPVVIDGYPYKYKELELGLNYYRRYRDLSIAGLGAIYLLSLIDAMVDAHFFYYDVSDDLSMRLEPALIENPGISAALGFRINLEF